MRRVDHVGKDYLSVDTPTEHIDARLDRVALVVAPNPAGGLDPRGGSITFKARLSEFEQTGEPVEIVAARLEASVAGRIQVVAEDHVVMIDRDQTSTVIPVGAIDLVIRMRRSR